MSSLSPNMLTDPKSFISSPDLYLYKTAPGHLSTGLSHACTNYKKNKEDQEKIPWEEQYLTDVWRKNTEGSEAKKQE